MINKKENLICLKVVKPVEEEIQESLKDLNVLTNEILEKNEFISVVPEIYFSLFSN